MIHKEGLKQKNNMNFNKFTYILGYLNVRYFFNPSRNPKGSCINFMLFILLAKGRNGNTDVLEDFDKA